MNNIGKIYFTIATITSDNHMKKISYARTFSRYDGGNKFTYFSFIGQDYPVIFPNDYYGKGDKILFVEFNLPEDVIKIINKMI
jgi:hypothetical protein